MEAIIIEAEVIEALRSCFDPEIPVNIYELGLIYDVKVDPSGAVGIQMTLTSPSCPAAQSLPVEVQAKTRGVRGVTDVTVDVVWDPPWESSKMSEVSFGLASCKKEISERKFLQESRVLTPRCLSVCSNARSLIRPFSRKFRRFRRAFLVARPDG